MPLSEIELRTSRSSGPGGQHANVTASRVEAVFDVRASSALDEAQKRRVAARLGPRVTAAAQDTRSQLRNRELALERLAERLAGALEVRRPRTATQADEGVEAAPRRRQEAPRRHQAVAAAAGGGLRRRKAGNRTAVEASAQREYEFTTTRIVLLVVSIVLWLLLGVARSARAAEDASFTIGYLLGTLGVGLLVAWIVRSVYRMIRRRPVMSPRLDARPLLRRRLLHVPEPRRVCRLGILRPQLGVPSPVLPPGEVGAMKEGPWWRDERSRRCSDARWRCSWLRLPRRRWSTSRTPVRPSRTSGWPATTARRQRRVGPGHSPRVSPDGRWVAWIQEGMPDQVMMRLADRSRKARVVARSSFVGELTFSPDSKSLGMVLSRRLFVYDIRERTEVKAASGVIRGFSFSPDSKSVVFGTSGRSDAGDAPSDLYSFELAEKTRVRITRDRKSLNPLWGPNGIVHDRQVVRGGDAPSYNLFEIQPDGGSLRRITRLRIPSLMSGLVPVEFAANGVRLLAGFVGQDVEVGFRVNTQTGKTHALDEDFENGFVGFDLSADGRTVLGHTGGPDPDRPPRRGDDALRGRRARGAGTAGRVPGLESLTWRESRSRVWGVPRHDPPWPHPADPRARARASASSTRSGSC